MVIFLTGVAGFIGSHLAEQLLAVGHQVIGFDNLDEQYAPALKQQNLNLFIDHPRFHFVLGDIRDQALVTDTMRRYQCDRVVHLAARAGVRSSVKEPARSIDVNVNGTLAVLEAMRINNVGRLVMASSSSVYGNSPCVPFREDDEAGTPLSPYAMSKRSAELLAYTYHHLYKMDISCLRFFTVYGPRQRPEMAISHFTEQIFHCQPITLFGDGSTARNYTYIHDTVIGILRAIYFLKGYNVLNIGGPSSVSLRELVHGIEQCVGNRAIIQWQPAQPGDVDLTCADLSRAADLIGYRPTIHVGEGLHRYVAWYRQRHVRERSSPRQSIGLT
jgi:UDP-glucuronate 4-epimerase